MSLLSVLSFSVSARLLRLFPDAIQHSDACAQIGRRNVVEQFVPKFESGGTNLFNDTPGARREMHRFATAIVRRILACDPTLALQPMQKRDQCWFFYAKMRRDLGLSQRPGRYRQMHQGAPFRLTQSHWLEALVQFQPPRPGGAVQKRSNLVDISCHGWKIVSLLTNSKSQAVSMPTTQDLG